MAVLQNVVRSGDEIRRKPTLGFEDSADVLGISWRTFKDGVVNKWIVPQAIIEKRQSKDRKRADILGFEPSYLADLKPIFADVRQGATVWTDKRITAAKKITARWQGKKVKG